MYEAPSNIAFDWELVDGRFQKVEGTDREIPADFVFLALGFVGPERGSWLDELGLGVADQRLQHGKLYDFDPAGGGCALTETVVQVKRRTRKGAGR